MSILRVLVGKRHAYTGEDVPWRMDTEDGETLFRYLRGGGVKEFGGTSAADAIDRRQTRFLIGFAALVAVWFVLWII